MCATKVFSVSEQLRPMAVRRDLTVGATFGVAVDIAGLEVAKRVDLNIGCTRKPSSFVGHLFSVFLCKDKCRLSIFKEVRLLLSGEICPATAEDTACRPRAEHDYWNRDTVGGG